jgi:hypothetical protein
MKSKLLISILLVLSHINIIQAQSNKGKVFIYWGWNGSNYTSSNLHLKGRNYNFTIHKMKATDRQSPLSLDYINPSQMTIPQYNFRIGYYIKDKISLSIGMDHMKYVMTNDQVAKISGNINNDLSIYTGNLNAKYTIARDFLMFEHTDGLNNLNIEGRWEENLLHIPLDKKNKGITINIQGGIGAGALIPKTNAKLFDQERHDEFHLAGFDAHVLMGIKLDIWKYFFIASEFKGGYINMPSIRTTHSFKDKASQAFGYIQYNILLGAQVNLRKQ